MMLSFQMVELSVVDKRLWEIDQKVTNSLPVRRSSSLEDELDSFLRNLPNSSTIQMCSPSDLRRFLAYLRINDN